MTITDTRLQQMAQEYAAREFGSNNTIATVALRQFVESIFLQGANSYRRALADVVSGQVFVILAVNTTKPSVNCELPYRDTIKMIKYVRSITGMFLKEAKDCVVDGVPFPVDPDQYPFLVNYAGPCGYVVKTIKQ